MALIKCLECGKQISDRALACPDCGSPTAFSADSKKDIVENVKAIAFLGGLAVLGALAFNYSKYCSRIPDGYSSLPWLGVLECPKK